MWCAVGGQGPLDLTYSLLSACAHVLRCLLLPPSPCVTPPPSHPTFLCQQQGLLPNLIKLAPAAGISWYVFEETKMLLGVDPRT